MAGRDGAKIQQYYEFEVRCQGNKVILSVVHTVSIKIHKKDEELPHCSD